MTGSAPAVTLAGSGVGRYWPGQQVRAVATAVDPDTRRELIAGGHDADGTNTTVTVDHVDQARIVSATWKRTGAPLTVSGMVVTGPAPRRSDAIVVVVEDAQRNQVKAELAVAVRALLIGVDVQGKATTRTQLDTAYAAWPTFPGSTKYFNPKGMPDWTLAAHAPAGSIPHVTWVEEPTDAQVDQILDGVPTVPTWPEIWLSWLQEGDRHTTAGHFVDVWGRIIQRAAGHPNRSRVRLVPNLTWYKQRATGDNYAAWIPAGLDYLGVDINPGTQVGYTDPAECLRAPLAAARAAGVPLVVPEAGVVVPASPTAAQLQARADWWAGLLKAADAAGDVYGVTVWQADGDQAVNSGGFIAGPTDPMRAVVTSYLPA